MSSGKGSLRKINFWVWSWEMWHSSIWFIESKVEEHYIFLTTKKPVMNWKGKYTEKIDRLSKITEELGEIFQIIW